MNETPDTTNAAAVLNAPVQSTNELPEQHQNETKVYADGTVATGPGPLPEQSPAEQDAAAAATALDEVRASDIELPTPERIISGFEVTGLGYVLNLQDIENIARIVHDYQSAGGKPFDSLDEDERDRIVTAIAESFDRDGMPIPGQEAAAHAADAVLMYRVANAIRVACDTLIADYLRMPVAFEKTVAHRFDELMRDDPSKASYTGVRSVEEARALPLAQPGAIAFLFEADGPTDIEAFKDSDGTTRRVAVMPDFTLARV